MSEKVSILLLPKPKLKNRLEMLIKKLEQMQLTHMQKYRNCTATPAQTKPYLDSFSDLNEQIKEIRDILMCD